MTDKYNQQRLAAVLAADVVGYTRLMEQDTEGTVLNWKLARDEVINPTVTEHKGRIVKLTGDGFLAEFTTVQEAVKCGIAMQEGFADNSLKFRIGINLGDIIDDGQDIHGEGVNVAARIEALAEPGGICISRSVYDQVRNRIEVTYEDMGEQVVKNVSSPVKVYAIRLASGAAAPPSVEQVVADQSSIAVLPFDNLSGDPEQEYFSDGISEDIITALSKLRGLRVIARNSTFQYKGRAVNVRQVANELDVRYLLEGSVRKSGNRIRISAQLIDGLDGTHIWAERYDRDLDDIFAVQDEITLVIATELQANLTEGEQARLRYTTTDNVEAWTLWVQGLAHFRGPITKDGFGQVRPYWEKALKLDPNSASLNAMLGFIHYADARFGWWEDREAAVISARTHIDKALGLDPDNSDAHTSFSLLLMLMRRFADAASHARKAVELAPSSADAAAFGGFVLTSCGFPEEGVSHIERAMKLSPIFPANYLGHLGNAYRLCGRTEEAIAAFKQYGERSPGFGHSDLVIAFYELNRPEKVKEAAEKLLVARPDFTISSWVETQFRKDTERLDADVAALVSAGLPMN